MTSQPGSGVEIPLLPWPESLEPGEKSLELQSSSINGVFTRITTPRLQMALQRLSSRVEQRTGLPDDSSSAVELHISCEQESQRYPALEEDESYWLVHDDAGIYLDAPTEWGVLRGLETLAQLIQGSGAVPHVAVDDRPRFPWRGLMLDPARHFLSVDAIHRTLDGMAMCKLNVLHLHLSDDQGFRFPSRAFPELASGQCYSLADLETIVEHAADLGIRVVPELDMPGHTTSWLTAYPQWGMKQVPASRRFGVHEACLDPASEQMYDVIDRLLGEVTAVFPDSCVHIGGDEVHPAWWSDDQGVAALMREHGFTDVQTVQAYFNNRVGQFVSARGRQVVAWDEVLHRELSSDWIVQAWRGATARDRALKHGNRVLVSAPYYLDLFFPADVHYGFDPEAEQAELIALEDAMTEDPRFGHVADGMRWTHAWRDHAVSGADQVHEKTLGGEACLWGELVDDEVLDARLWSRLPAVAERFWSAAHFRDPRDLHKRLDWYLAEIHPCLGVDVRGRSRAQLASIGITERWLILTDLLEPVKWYGRLLGEAAMAGRIRGQEMPKARPYDADTPLNGVADYLLPESFEAHRLDDLCADISAGASGAKLDMQQRCEGWLALAADSGSAPAGLGSMTLRLGLLAAAVTARLDGSPVSVHQVEAITAPDDGLMIAVGGRFRDWLLQA